MSDNTKDSLLINLWPHRPHWPISALKKLKCMVQPAVNIFWHCPVWLKSQPTPPMLRNTAPATKYRSWVLVKCVWCGAYYWFWLRKGTGYGFHAFLTCMLLLLLLIQCKISLYFGLVRTVRPVQCFVTPPTPLTQLTIINSPYRSDAYQRGALVLYSLHLSLDDHPNKVQKWKKTFTLCW